MTLTGDDLHSVSTLMATVLEGFYEKRIEPRLDSLESELADVKSGLARVESRLTKVESRLDRVEVAVSNSAKRDDDRSREMIRLREEIREVDERLVVHAKSAA